MTPMLHFWPAPLQALVLVVSPRLGLRHHLYRDHNVGGFLGELDINEICDHFYILVGFMSIFGRLLGDE